MQIMSEVCSIKEHRPIIMQQNSGQQQNQEQKKKKNIVKRTDRPSHRQN